LAKKAKKTGAPARAAPPKPAPAPLPPPHARRRWLLPAIGGFVVLLAILGVGAFETMQHGPAETSVAVTPPSPVPPPSPSPAPAASPKPAPTPAAFVGGEACADCHAGETAAWKGSHHALAMQHASAATVLGDFANADFEKDGVTTHFSKRGDEFWVSTDGPDGKPHDYRIAFTFGIAPLQQYLVEFGKGRLQSLPIAWDTRPKEKGGQRWFHLYSNDHLKAGDALHWTGLQQNWNFMCADCHSTGLQRNYDPKTDSFATAWSDVNVTCEACHGPGSRHVAWAKDGAKPGDDGLTVRLDERRDVTWTLNEATGNSTRSVPRTTSVELQVCARCHSRGGPIWNSPAASTTIGDIHHVAALDQGLYFPDGQIRDEVFEYGSFLQSRMNHAGVTCSDCHEPHSATLRAPGNGVCLQCHEATKFDVTAHTHHAAGTDGALCANCHMPERTYMVVDPRRDHSIRIPRPDLSVSLGTPNACTTCHTDRDAAWAAAAVKSWFPHPSAPFQTYAALLDAGDKGAPGARVALLAFAADPSGPGIARASALDRLDTITNAADLATLRRLLGDADPLLRRSAAGAYARLPADVQLDLLPVLDDPVRDVRLAVVPPLAALPADRLTPGAQAKRAAAIQEYVTAQNSNADRPEAHQNLGQLYAVTGRLPEAIAEFLTAIRLDPTFVAAPIALADLYRGSGRDAEGEAVLRAAVAANPGEAGPHGALGLWLVRAGRGGEALAELKLAAEMGSADPRNAYVYAVALSSAGLRPQAMAVLEAGLARHPYDRDMLIAGATFGRDAGDIEAARRYAQTLAELEPQDPSVAALLKALDGAPMQGGPLR